MTSAVNDKPEYTEADLQRMRLEVEKEHARTLALCLGLRLEVDPDWGEMLREVRRRCNGPAEDEDLASWRVHRALLTLQRDWNELPPPHQKGGRLTLRAFAQRIRSKPEEQPPRGQSGAKLR